MEKQPQIPELTPDPDAAPWWEGIAAGELRFQRCSACGEPIFYPRARCPYCFADDPQWLVSEGTGSIYAYTVVHRAPSKEMASRTPYVVALVDLDEGFRMMTNIVDSAPEAVRVGLPVEVVFRVAIDGRRIPCFTLRVGTEAGVGGSGNGAP